MMDVNLAYFSNNGKGREIDFENDAEANKLENDLRAGIEKLREDVAQRRGRGDETEIII